ncbi:hypothetical protein SAMN05216548_110152 [Faunimonas pinastri]|uniref:Uncharacterized protein n=1 Tax=Faunimonas pinastri TaxID=1855383 RepID=A0A1H9L0V1_9HYPH|nr:hypothetical protein [Faunimonas pinastri]SER05026.1 hypothetical protein SAMN05216548_110152 [Faunimonas pinastri]
MQGWKTVTISALIAIFGALQGLDWANLIPNATYAGWIISAIGVVMLVLRTLTRTPVGQGKIASGDAEGPASSKSP